MDLSLPPLVCWYQRTYYGDLRLFLSSCGERLESRAHRAYGAISLDPVQPRDHELRCWYWPHGGQVGYWLGAERAVITDPTAVNLFHSEAPLNVLVDALFETDLHPIMRHLLAAIQWN